VKLLVYGSAAFGTILRDLVGLCGHQFSGFIDDVYGGPDVVGEYAAARSKCPPGEFGVVLAIGYRDLDARWRVFERVVSDGYAVPVLVHPEAYVRTIESIGNGSIIMARAIVDLSAKVGECCVLWPGANVSHDSAVGRNSFLSPNCTICGFASIGPDCFVGAGAVVADHCDVPAGSFVKAGSVFAAGRPASGLNGPTCR
jgi:sugar O-acyltransferase (sialic acid O-acetyltransferase NeuD family)